MPVPPTSISAATITNQTMPMEMRMPVRMVGAAAGRIMVKARRSVPTSSVRAGKNPHREGFPGKRIEINTIGDLADITQSRPRSAGEHLLDYRDRLVEIIRRRDRLGD